MATHRTARILVVDHEPAVRAVVSRALQEAGYQVGGGNDGGPIGTLFDLVITSGYVPHLTGAEMAAELRRRFPAQPILHLDDLSRPHGSSPPDGVADHYWPFSIDRLLEGVERMLIEGALKRDRSQVRS